MHSGCDNVAGGFFGKLNDVLTQIGFHNLISGVFERMIELHFLGNHRFSFGHAFCIGLRTDFQHQLIGLLGSLCPVDLPATIHHRPFKLLKVITQIIQGMVFYGFRACFYRIKFGQRIDSRLTLVYKAAPRNI